MTLAGWSTASTKLKATTASATAGPSLTLMCDDDDTVNGTATWCTSSGMANAVSIASKTAYSKDTLSRPDNSTRSSSSTSFSTIGGDAMALGGRTYELYG